MSNVVEDGFIAVTKSFVLKLLMLYFVVVYTNESIITLSAQLRTKTQFILRPAFIRNEEFTCAILLLVRFFDAYPSSISRAM